MLFIILPIDFHIHLTGEDVVLYVFLGVIAIILYKIYSTMKANARSPQVIEVNRPPETNNILKQESESNRPLEMDLRRIDDFDWKRLQDFAHEKKNPDEKQTMQQANDTFRNIVVGMIFQFYTKYDRAFALIIEKKSEVLTEKLTIVENLALEKVKSEKFSA